MKKKILLLFLTVTTSALLSALETKSGSIDGIFSNANISGNFRTISAGYKQEVKPRNSNYATAVGARLKYELATYKGFSGAISFMTSNDVNYATGSGVKQNSELSSSNGEYTQMNESYLNYKYNGLNFRVGRQIIDTPLADSDDWLIIANSFEAYMLTYEFENATLIAGNLQSWQGVDAGLDAGWIDIDNDGAIVAGAIYRGDVEASLYYYDFPMLGSENISIYADMSYDYKVNKTTTLAVALQCLSQEGKNSSAVGAEIFGFLSELSLNDMRISVAYNHSAKKSGKASFSGLGGGTLFTSVYYNVMDQVTNDREVNAIALGAGYTLNKLDVSYMYASYNGAENTLGNKAHLIEHDIVVEYSLSDDFLIHAALSISGDMESSMKTADDFNRFHIAASYNF